MKKTISILTAILVLIMAVLATGSFIAWACMGS